MRGNFGTWMWATGTALILTFAAAGTSRGADKPSEDAVAVVNGSVITQADLDIEMADIQQRFSDMGRPLSDSQVSGMKKRFLESLIERELLYQQSRKEDIDVDEALLEEQLRALEKQYRRKVAVQQFIEKKFAVSEEEMKAYYESDPNISREPAQIRASHILVKMNPAADELKQEEARRKIEEIRDKLRAGEDFSSLAKEWSECPSSAKGGDLGYFRRGRMVKPFDEAAFAMGPGDISEIVQTRFGYHLIKVTDKKPESIVPYDKAKDEIEQRLRMQKRQRGMRAYLDTLKEEANIQRFPMEAPQ
jgi:peptidyl-prolyl cis-trans isomerase C